MPYADGKPTLPTLKSELDAANKEIQHLRTRLETTEKKLEVAMETERKRCVAVCKLHTDATVSMVKQKDLRAANMIQVAMDLVATDIELGTEF